jgi:hypothetical protein
MINFGLTIRRGMRDRIRAKADMDGQIGETCRRREEERVGAILIPNFAGQDNPPAGIYGHTRACASKLSLVNP